VIVLAHRPQPGQGLSFGAAAATHHDPHRTVHHPPGVHAFGASSGNSRPAVQSKPEVAAYGLVGLDPASLLVFDLMPYAGEKVRSLSADQRNRFCGGEPTGECGVDLA